MYVDAINDPKHDRIHVVERTPEGKRNYQEFPTNYVFYYPDKKGKYRSIYDDPLSRFSTRKKAEFEKEKRIHSGKKLFESDVNTVFRCLADNYLGVEPPKLHTAFFDIEVDFDETKGGFAPPHDPFNQVTAIALYLDWLDQLICLAIPPKHMTDETAQELVQEFPNTFLFRSEIEMFETFFELIEDADVLTGWNSEGFDIPYMVNRVTRIMSKDDTRKFCLLNQLPKVRTYERFGKEEQTYDLVGRIHMDYLQLYKKYNYESRHSYSLDAIAEMELKENKIPYEGTLDQLYNRDFKEFIRYNRQDTMLVARIHQKLKFLELANALAHENTVLIPTVMGSVAMIEMAIFNEAHARGMIVPDKQRSSPDQMAAAGAYVADPKPGLHQWIGAIDINSLYPSTIRALNMSSETIIGQIRQTKTDQYMIDRATVVAKEKRNYDEDDEDLEMSSLLWEGLFGSLEYTSVMNQERGTILTVDFEDGRSQEMSAAEIWKMIFDSHNPYILSANGTIFRYDREGVIPGLLSRWYSERKDLQKKLALATTATEKEYWDKRQLVRKILLNSAYGALLNEHCRFYDKRLGQSVTLTGRQIVRHMNSQINEIIAGVYDHEGESMVYADTDSGYFSAWPLLEQEVKAGRMEWNKEIAIQVYDTIADQVNDSFPGFMEQSFHCPRTKGAIIKGGREIVGDTALFIKKKRYAVNVYDKEGTRKDVDGKMGSIKAMGLDLKRSDTPKYIQKFLMDILTMTLANKTKEEIVERIKEFKRELSDNPGWTKGSPKSVNKLTYYGELEARSKTGKVTMPGHVRAAINWNTLKRVYNDNYSMSILDGMKVIVCKLRPNPLGYTSVAYPTDELRLPEWFTQLPFDDATMETTLVDKKIENLLGVLKWELKASTDTSNTLDNLFSFG
jgi:DNA polymerase elongation subunit (family B)